VSNGLSLDDQPIGTSALTAREKALLALATNRYLRKLGGSCYTLLGRISANLSLDPIVEIHLPFHAIGGKLTVHIFKRDLTSIIEVFVNHVYDRFCALNPGETVIDCGAYIGEFSIYAANKVGTNGLVLAFEPNPQSFSICRRNLVQNNVHNAKLFNCALGDKEASAYLVTDETNLGATKVVGQGKFFEPPVQVRQLDGFLQYVEGRRIKLIKVDVEGAAVGLIRGAASLLEKRMIENVSAELHPGEEGLPSLLQGYGFTCTQRGSYLYASLSDEIVPVRHGG